jgi:AcrR family transcriptional regulator
MPSAPTARKKTSTLDASAWFKAVFVMVAENGVESVSVAALAKRLGATKGSFYWHFPDRESLLFAVLDRWRRMMTSDIKSFIAKAAGTPAGRLHRLLKVAISPRPHVLGGQIERSLHEWARHDPRVAAIMRSIDDGRLGYVRQLYIEAGLDEETADAYAFAHLCYVIGGRQLPLDGTRKDIERRIKIGDDLLISKQASKQRQPARRLKAV